jgi:hypothetical protein
MIYPSKSNFMVLEVRYAKSSFSRRWWFASTAIPLLAATIGPLANVLSIAALVTQWRSQLANDGVLPEGADERGVGIPDPQWSVGKGTYIGRIKLI